MVDISKITAAIHILDELIENQLEPTLVRNRSESVLEIEGVLANCPIGQPNRNGRIYTREAMESLVRSGQEKISRQILPMMIGEGERPEARISNVVGFMTSIELCRDGVSFRASITNQAARELFCGEIISFPEGIATVNDDVVQPDYDLSCVRLCLTPGREPDQPITRTSR